MIAPEARKSDTFLGRENCIISPKAGAPDAEEGAE